MAKNNNLRVVGENFSLAEEVDEPPKAEMATVLSRLIDFSHDRYPIPKPKESAGAEIPQDFYSTGWDDAATRSEASSTERTAKAPEMSTPSREEFDAKLREMAAQMETRALRTDNKIDEMLRRLETRDAVQDERLRAVSNQLQSLSGDVVATRDSVGSLKTTIITTTIATGLAVTALIYTLNTSLFTAFESGKTTASALSDASNKLAQVTDRLDALSKQPAPPPPNPAPTPTRSKK